MEADSIFGTEPDRLKWLLKIGRDEHESVFEDEKPLTTSLDGLMEKPGARIGRYKLLRVLGEGGMGTVYLAQQEEPVGRQVALKIIKLGMDSKRVIARFDAEQQALALMEHSHVARVYDAGLTANGRPYFVMEYVKGAPITEHSDKHNLTVEERLRLFLHVCKAVQHAHQKGIIHRDLKPSNILVSIEGNEAIPKIIDFGVAKAIAAPLTERTLATEDSQLLGTPEYMSPEQVDMANEDIDTRSDIYSLGVLLYELLTGVLPFDSDTLRDGGIERIRQVIRETDPKTPSTRLSKLGEDAKKVAESRRTEVATLTKKLHKELEWIPLKAMRKDRAERYRSASEMADDIENYLKGEPLIAGPQGTLYRLSKSVRRHKALVAGTLVVIVVSVIGTAVSIIFAIGQSRARAEAQSIADFLRIGVLGTVRDANVGEATVTYMLDAASKNLDGLFSDQPLVEATIRDTIGWTYRELGEHKAAEPHLERAFQIRMEHLSEKHMDTLNSMERLAWIRADQGRNTEAAELLEKALSTCRGVLGEEHTNTLSMVHSLVPMYNALARYDEAERLYLKNIPIARRVLGEKNYLTLLMVGNLGNVYMRQGRYDEAEYHLLDMLRSSNGFGNDEYEVTLVYTGFLARVYRKQKRYDEAERLYLEILPKLRSVSGPEHWRTLRVMKELAQVYTLVGKYDEAQKLFTEAMESYQRVRGREHRDTLKCMNGLAELRMKQKQYNEAESLFYETLEARKLKLGDDHPETLETKNDLAMLYKEQGDYDKAEPLLLEAVKGRRLKLGDTHPHTIESLENLIDLYEAWNKPDKAKELLPTEAAKQ